MLTCECQPERLTQNNTNVLNSSLENVNVKDPKKINKSIETSQQHNRQLNNNKQTSKLIIVMIKLGGALVV